MTATSIKLNTLSNCTASIYRQILLQGSGSTSSSIYELRMRVYANSYIDDGDVLSVSKISGSTQIPYYTLNGFSEGTSSAEYTVYLRKPYTNRFDLINTSGSLNTGEVFVSKITNLLKY